MDEKDRAQAQLKTEALSPGEKYTHYKGGEYEVVTCAIDEDTLQPMVVYKSIEKGTFWIRTLYNWNETIEVEGKLVKRFQKVSG